MRFALDPASWKGFGLLCLAVPCILYAGFKFIPVVARFITSRSFYTKSLYGLDKTVRRKMGDPEVLYHTDSKWLVRWHAEGEYDLLRSSHMTQILEGKWKGVKTIQVPDVHLKIPKKHRS